MLKQMPLCGKKRTFKNINMEIIFDFQSKRQDILNSDKSAKEKVLAEGKLLGNILDITPEEFAKITPDEYGLMNNISQIYTLAATKITEKEMDDYIEDMKLASVKGQIAFMSDPGKFQDKMG